MSFGKRLPQLARLAHHALEPGVTVRVVGVEIAADTDGARSALAVLLEVPDHLRVRHVGTPSVAVGVERARLDGEGLAVRSRRETGTCPAGS